MLKYLNISNFAVVEQVEVRFQEGLNLLTGETGSGKSIIVDSLGLLMGGRGSSVQVRTRERVATVEGVFEPLGERRLEVARIIKEAGVEAFSDGELLIRREIHANGRSRIFIEDQSVTAQTLRALQPFLIEIHGQGEHRSLLNTQSQMDLLDSFNGALPLRREVAEAFRRWRRLKEELMDLQREIIERERAGDFLQFQLSEIEQIAPKPLEDEELAAERKLLAHAEKLLELGGGAYAELYERDGSLLERLALVRKQLEELSSIDARMASWLEALETSAQSLTDVADALRGYGEQVDFSPGRLAEIEHRLSELERLKRKHQTDLEGILKIQDELSEKLRGQGDLSEREKGLREELKKAEAFYVRAAERLTASRRQGAEALAERVMTDLKFVAMEQANFVVHVETAEAVVAEASVEGSKDTVAGPRFFTQDGADRVEFYLSANPGEEPRPLSKVVSGGELSRLMLTLRTVSLAGEALTASGATIIFDEIDVGIGGRVAEAVGRRLKSLAETRQVLCVTHQPQIARFADHHFMVEKASYKGRTRTGVRELVGDERVNELARMIGGGEEGAQTTLEAARWLLERADAPHLVRAGERGRKILNRK